ncbi:MAG: hypothetical protein AAB388_03670 [Patescibacteria group bacterium]
MFDWLYKKFSRFFESVLGLLPLFVLLTLSGVVLLVIFQSKTSFNQLIELLKVTIWPTIVLLLLLFFKKVFTYLFFSIEEFNFFGAKGKLKNVRSVVMEKAEDMYQSRLEQEKQEKENEKNKNELAMLRASKDNEVENKKKILDLAERILADKEKLVEENNSLKKKIDSILNSDGPSAQDLQQMISDLLAQVSALQKQLGEDKKVAK